MKNFIFNGVSNVQSFFMNGGTVLSIDGPLSDVSMIDGKILIGGVPIEEYEAKNNTRVTVTVVVTGSVTSIENANQVVVNGNVGTIRTHNGSVNCKDVTGDVTTHNGSIHCGNVGGNVRSHNGSITRR